MPAPGQYSLSKGEVMMYLALAGCQRRQAAEQAGISEATLFRLMKHYRISAPKSNAKLNPMAAMEIRALLEKHSERQVAEMKGVHWRTVQQVSSWQTWYRRTL